MFGFGRKKVLGIDIGTSFLKVVELELRDGKPYLSNYAWVAIAQKRNENNGRESESFEANVVQSLKRIIKEAKLKKTEAFVSIPAFSGLVTLIDFPAMPSEDMKQAIRFEAQKYIPTSLDDVVISWEEIEKTNSNNSGKINQNAPAEKNEKKQILLVAASKKKVMAYEEIIKKSGLKLKRVEMENIAIVEALIGNDEGNFIIVDIGSRACNIIYAERGIVKINRNIDIGGSDITRTIEKNLGVSNERAEMMKISGENFFTGQSGLHFPVLDVIVGEISRIKELISKNGKELAMDALLLSGGTAKLSGLKEFLENKTGIKTVIGNPFSRIGYDQRLENSLGKIDGQLAVCVGLALKGIKEMIQEKK